MKNKIKLVQRTGEFSSYYEVGDIYENTNTKIDRIELERKVIGKGYYNDLEIDCYVAYDESGNRLIETNEGTNIEIKYFAK